MNDTALIIVDAQVNMFDSGIFGGDALLAKLQSLVVQARAADMPIVFVQNNGGEGDPDMPGTEGWRIHPALTPESGDIIIQKWVSDSFHETPLRAELEARGVKRVIIAGMQTDYCINATTRRAADLGYTTTLIADAHSTFDGSKQTAAEIIAQHNNNLAAVATVLPSDEIGWAK